MKVDGRGENRAGFIASIGSSIVSSSTWKCKPGSPDDNVVALAQPGTDDSNWEKAVEMGTNEGEGTTPWGTVPGMASKAFGYTHDAYMKKKSSAICRVDTDNAWHSYSKERLGASRWSCRVCEIAIAVQRIVECRNRHGQPKVDRRFFDGTKSAARIEFRDELF